MIKSKNIMRHPKNESGYYELFAWEPRGKEVKDYMWHRCAVGSKEDMLWVMKVMIATIISITGGRVGERMMKPEEFLFIIAQYLILSPDNIPIPIPQLCEIKCPHEREKKDDDKFEVVLEMLDKFPLFNVQYEGRL